jgi:hypothetical protein
MRLPADAVLLIIDAQEAIDGPRRDAGEAPEAEKNIAALIAAWRAEGLPLVHVGRQPTGSASALTPAVPPREGEMVIVRNASSAFVGADLEARLDELGATTLVICGALASHALEASATRAGRPTRSILKAGSGRRRRCGRWRWRVSRARPRPSSTSRRRSEPPRRPRRANGVQREEPNDADQSRSGYRRSDWRELPGTRASLRDRTISGA